MHFTDNDVIITLILFEESDFFKSEFCYPQRWRNGKPKKNAQNLSKSVKSNLCFVVALRIRLNMNLVYITKRCLKTDNTISNHSKLADEVRTRTRFRRLNKD